jgi:hypothetical protein
MKVTWLHAVPRTPPSALLSADLQTYSIQAYFLSGVDTAIPKPWVLATDTSELGDRDQGAKV